MRRVRERPKPDYLEQLTAAVEALESEERALPKQSKAFALTIVDLLRRLKSIGATLDEIVQIVEQKCGIRLTKRSISDALNAPVSSSATSKKRVRKTQSVIDEPNKTRVVTPENPVERSNVTEIRTVPVTRNAKPASQSSKDANAFGAANRRY